MKNFKELPFVKVNPQGTIDSFWHVQSTENWTADNKRGAEYAILLLTFIRDNKAPALFSSVIKDVPKYGLSHLGGFNGISIGFLHEIARRAIG